MNDAFTERQQGHITKRTLRSLEKIGFAQNGSHWELQIGESLAICAQPPQEGNYCWRVKMWDKRKESAANVGMAGTTSFSGKWATTESVLIAIFQMVHQHGRQTGITEERVCFQSKVDAAVKLLKE